MSKLKIILIFAFLLTIPSYFVLKSKNIDIRSFLDPKLRLNLNNLLQEKINSSKNNEIIITEDELNTMFKPYTKTLRNFYIDITSKNITVKGETTIPTRYSVDIKIVPEVKETKLTYRIEQMNMNNSQIPNALSNPIKQKIDEYLDREINDKIKIKELNLEEDKIILKTLTN